MTEQIVLPPLQDFDRDKLRESIQEYGVLEPVVVDENGDILDGRNRADICAELGREYPTRTVSGLSAEQKRIFTIHLNVPRRHLTIEQRRHIWQEYRTVIADRLRQDPARSDRDVASELSVDHHTVAKERAQLEENGDIPILERRGRAEPKEAAENYADHRGDVWFEITFGYPGPPSEIIRRRGEDPFPSASERVTWSSGRMYLTTPAPRDAIEHAKLLEEVVRRVQRETATRAWKTMQTRTAVVA